MQSGNVTRDGILAGQVALVTGAGRGLGPFLAEGLAAAGAAVAVIARTAKEVEAVAGRITAAGGCALALPVDVTDQRAVERMVTEVEHHLGSVDILINNAALAQSIGSAWEVDPDTWWRDIEVNVRGPFLCARAILPGMIARRRGRIVNISSGAGAVPFPLLSAYAASKAALINFTESLAAETQQYGVSVFAINPGLFRTPMTERFLEDDPLCQQYADLAQALRDGRTSDPEAVVRMIVALGSGQADGLSGRFLNAPDDLEELLRRTESIVHDDLYTLRWSYS
jgi:NAD(P)-dependent dehydrogenase (short-subunit alcohol dehydrogenase family)